MTRVSSYLCPSSCHFHGICVQMGDLFRCACTSGFSGFSCATSSESLVSEVSADVDMGSVASEGFSAIWVFLAIFFFCTTIFFCCYYVWRLYLERRRRSTSTQTGQTVLPDFIC
uniref:EGF-like domain-containing protein n=1 Tax=Caenorhabditis japonica TaxID=281687 RepID=A0A8R1EW44_CAEJA